MKTHHVDTIDYEVRSLMDTASVPLHYLMSTCVAKIALYRATIQHENA